MPFRFSTKYILDNLSKTRRTKKQILSFAIDAGIVAFCLWSAFSLRYGEVYSDISNIPHLVLILPPATVLIFAGLGVYRWVVRTSSRRQFEQLLKGSLISAFILQTLLYLSPYTNAPRSVFIIYGVLIILTSVGVRLLWARVQNSDLELSGKPIVIYGAGAAGRQLVNLMKLSNDYHPEFFLDDDENLSEQLVSGVKVFNPNKIDIEKTLRKYEIDEVILAMPSLRGKSYSDKLKYLERFNLPVKTTPTIEEIVSGKSSPDEVRDIKLEDLLGRDPVQPDTKLFSEKIHNKRILVTGAGGSIGSELCRQILKFRPQALILYDNSEPSLYAIDQELKSTFPESYRLIVPCLGSVTDRARLNQVFQKHNPNTVYHAAAYKHVHLVESNPFEGVKTNVLGTRNVIDVSEKYHTNSFVMISTDKAVRPTNIMGASKRVAELTVQGRAANPEQCMKLSMVRFGNVLGSSGSVVPLFKKQISNGGPVTVTHPEMIRYFMLIPEAVSLVLQAGAMAQGGEVFLLEMGKPVKITDLAKAMIRLHGFQYYEDINSESTRKNREDTGFIEIKYTGIRDGEKLFEELLIDGNSTKTDHPKIYKAIEPFFESKKFEVYLKEIELAIEKEDEDILKSVFNQIVSGYKNETNRLDESVHANDVKNSLDIDYKLQTQFAQ